MYIFKDKVGLSFRHPFLMFELKMSRSVLMHRANESQVVEELFHTKGHHRRRKT